MKSNRFTPIGFMKYTPLYYAISLLVIIPGLVSLFAVGLKPAIDFTGGALMELQFPHHSPTENQILASASGILELASIQSAPNNGYVIRTKPLDKLQHDQFKYSLASLSASLSATTSANLNDYLIEHRFETVGPTLGQELLQKTIVSIALAAGAILLYVAYRFNELKFGVTAVIAMFHDTLILLGIFSLLGYYLGIEVDTLFVTAVLTTLSFSVHDTIVVYDRIRESRKKYPQAPLVTLVNKAVTETLPRSINNSMTIIFMLLSLWLLGGESIKWFVFALLIGTIAGTYSSTFTAAPLLVAWDRLTSKEKSK